ncbi:hypothetical protein FACS189418_4020 [Clostridia bacterium]|nr:hypothetical protein FACS189418_4020 [Clostridia bacterium]
MKTINKKQNIFKKLTPKTVLVIAMLLVCIGIIFYFSIQRFMPSRVMTDKSTLFQLKENQIPLIYQFEQSSDFAVQNKNEYYFPISFINHYIDSRFFLDEIEQKLLYALPDQLLEFSITEETQTGQPKFLTFQENLYLSSIFIQEYTDFFYQVYEDKPARIVVYPKDIPLAQATVKKKTALRVKEGIKSATIEKINKNQSVYIIDSSQTWSLIQTETGFIGYIPNQNFTKKEDKIFSSSKIVDYKNIQKPYPIKLGWHQVTTKKANDNLENILKQTKGLNTISPTWFFLSDEKGNIESLATPEYVQKAHSLNLEVWGLIENIKYQIDEWNLFTSTANRKRLVNTLIQEALRCDLDGLNVDIEALNERAAPAYLQFLRELSIACRQHSLVLSIDNYVPSPSSAFYNRKEQGIIADYIMIMAYDEHYASSPTPGSVASLPFVSDGIVDTLKEVPKEKVITAIPFYARIWKEENGKLSSESLSLQRIQQLIQEKNLSLNWLDNIGQYYTEYMEGNSNRKIWIEDGTSLDLKMKLIQEHQLAGVACWKLGLETPDVWNIIDNYLH